jgi:hypothetical protein
MVYLNLDTGNSSALIFGPVLLVIGRPAWLTGDLCHAFLLNCLPSLLEDIPMQNARGSCMMVLQHISSVLHKMSSAVSIITNGQGEKDPLCGPHAHQI